MARLPDYMQPPPGEHPSPRGGWHPHIIAHDVRDDGTVLVTWALPNLRTATVRVGYTEWCNGEHARTGAFLASQVAALEPRQRPPERPERPVAGQP